MTTTINLLLIDSRIKDLSTFVAAINPTTTKYIVFDYLVETFDSIKVVIQQYVGTDKISHIGFVQEIPSTPTFQLFGANGIQKSTTVKVEINDPNLITWSQFVDFINYLRSTYNITNVDFFACRIYSLPYWKYIFQQLTTKTNVIYGASSDLTGNLSVGANWIAESDAVNLKTTYLTDAITNYHNSFNMSYSYKMFIRNDNTVYTCGHNYAGQMGSSTIENSNDIQIAPTDVIVLDNLLTTNNIIQVMTFDYDYNGTYFLLEDKTTHARSIYAIGSYITGSTNNYEFNILPQQVVLPDNINTIIQMTANPDTILILYEISPQNRAIYCSGFNGNGEFGNGNSENTWNQNFTLSLMTGNIICMASGYNHNMVIYEFEPMRRVIGIWGGNYYGQLGIGSNSGSTYPAPVLDPTGLNVLEGNITEIASGGDFSAVVMDGQAFMFGSNGNGQLGIGSTDNTNLPVLVSALTGNIVLQISCTNTSTLFLVEGSNGPSNRMMYSCGSNWYGQLGIGTQDAGSIVPVPVSNGDGVFFGNITQINCVQSSCYALMADGSVYAWGENGQRNLGIGMPQENYTIPTLIDITNVKYLDFVNSLTYISPYIRPSFRLQFSMSSNYSDNSRVYYKAGSLPACGVGSTTNSRFKSRRI